MVLEQQNVMSEHNTQPSSDNGQPDLALAHSKKMSLANKMKKQRKLRQSGTESPIPNEGGASVGSKSPLRSSSSGDSGRDSNTTSSSQQQGAPTGGAAPSASSSNDGKAAGGSVGSSLLHNKRRAMQLAKTRRSQDQNKEKSPAKPQAKKEPSVASPSPVATDSTPVKSNDMSASRVGLTEPAFHNNNSKPKPAKVEEQEPPAPPTVEPSFAEEEVTPVQRVESSAYAQYAYKPKEEVAPAQRVESSAYAKYAYQPKQKKPQAKAVNPAPVPPPVPPKELPTEDVVPQKTTEEVVPWETEEPEDLGVQPCNSDDTDAWNCSQAGVSVVSNGRSVVSNGVVDYDESIMSLARLDNFRSKSNQSKANKQVAYPGSSGIPKSSAPSSDKPPSQVWKSPGRKNNAPRASPVRASSWKEKPTNSIQNEQQPKPRGQGGAVPPWMKSPAKTNTDQRKVPASETPSEPVSPARSSFSAAPSFNRAGSPFLAAAPKFSSSRSDVGVEPMPLPKARRESGTAGKSWRPPSATKKTVVSSKDADMRAPSPTPSSSSDQLSCPVSPTQSLTSEAESDAGKSLPAVPKAKVWSTSKKPTPSWLKRGNSTSNIPAQPPASFVPASPKRSSSKVSESKEVMEPKPVTSYASKAKNNFSSPLPSIPKPVSSSIKKAPVNDPVEHQPTSRSPRRHSFSTSPSWAKPAANETEETDPLSQSEKTQTPVATAKTWSAKKQTPSWMKKANDSEEPTEKPPPAVPTTKVWSAKKQTPAWMKKSQETENENEEAAPTPSPRRMSTPSWMKPGQASTPGLNGQAGPTPTKDIVASVSPQTSVAGKAPETPSSPPRNTAKIWKTSTPNVGEQRPTPSPRSQSWKPRPQPSPDKVGAGTKKVRHSIGGDSQKVASAANAVKNQRSPSPSVAQLQEQIFVTKLGVCGESKEAKPRLTKPPTSSPSPQVKQLQQIIFSPEKKNRVEPKDQPNASPAAGWWKRVPNAPEIRTDYRDAQGWKHEGSSASVCDEPEHPDVSPSPTMQSEGPIRKSWRRPSVNSAVSAGAPSWLKDVAEFHSNSPKKLPSQPPVFQEPEEQPQMEQLQMEQRDLQQTERPPVPSSPQTSDVRPKTAHTPSSPITDRNLSSPKITRTSSSPRTSRSPMLQNSVDEGSSDLMVVSSNSTTSRNDVVEVQQEDPIKSLIQMAADSVLIADYEQAMQRVVVDSKSEDEEDSVGNGAGNAIPNDLPLEFQRSLAADDEAAENESNVAEGGRGTPQQNPETHLEETDVAMNTSSASRDRDLDVIADQRQARAASPVIHTPNTSFRSAGSADSGKSKPGIADRAKALLGWSERRVAPPKYEEMQDDVDDADLHNIAPQDRDQHEHFQQHATESVANETRLANIQQDENGFPCVPVQDENGFPCIQDETGFPDENGFPCVVQDENGFPCAPLAEASIPATFGTSDFHSAQWVDESSDEKKDSSEILQYWSPEMDTTNDSSQWASRDPGLDTAPDPLNESAEDVILKAEKVLRQAEDRMAPGGFTRDHEPSAPTSSMDGWVDRSRSSRSKENVPSTHATAPDMWDVDDHQHQHAPKDYSRTPERHQNQQYPEEAGWSSPSPNPPRHEPVAMADPMWGSVEAVDATWGSPPPDPFSTATAHFDEVVPSKREQGDVFDPFGEEEDGLGFPPFSEPPDEFVAVASFSPPAFAPRHGQHQANAHADVFDTYYHPNSGNGYPEERAVKPASREMEDRLQYI